MEGIVTAGRHYDVIIVGARVAGAATAMLLARAGVRVLAIDRQARGADTLSTHAFMRGGVHLLSRWGILPSLMAAATPVVTTTNFHYGDAAPVRIPIRADADVPGLLAPRRALLDLTLVEAAERAGAEIAHRTVLRSLLTDARGRVTGIVSEDRVGTRRQHHAPLVIGADGVGSQLARFVGAPFLARGRNSSTSLFGYVRGLANTGYHWHYGRDAAAGLIPTNDGETCAFVSLATPRFDRGDTRDPGAVFTALLASLDPKLARRIGTPRRLLAFRGRPGHLRQAHGPGWALVGDAGFFRDPLTAHGMTDALRDADLLAAAILAGNAGALARYEAERDVFARPILDVTDRIVSFTWTLDELRDLHLQLSAVMKVEAARIAGFVPAPPSLEQA